MTIHKKDNPGASLKVRHSIDVSPDGVDIRGLIDLAEKNPQRFAEISAQLTRSGKLRWEDVDMRALFLATIDVPLKIRAHIDGLGERTITTSMFPVLAGNLTAELLERTDTTADNIWPQLVTVRDTNKETTHLVRIVNFDPISVGGRTRKEGDPYPVMGTAEERVQVDTVDDGRRVAIGAKMLEVNDKAGFMEQVIALRQWAMNRRDVVTLQRVYDVYGSGASPAQPYVYRPNGTGTQLYTTSTTAHKRAPSGTRITNQPLLSIDNLTAVIQILANMRDENGYRVGSITELDLVCPFALSTLAYQLVQSEMVPGILNDINPYGPKGQYRVNIITSPKIDDFTTQDWLLGRRVQQQFTMVSRINMEFVSMVASMTDFLRTRLAYEARVSDEFEVGARDHNRVVQALATATAPTGPTLGS